MEIDREICQEKDRGIHRESRLIERVEAIPNNGDPKSLGGAH